MPRTLRPLLVIALFGLAACDELAVADDPEALADLRGSKSCVAAVAKETGASGVTVNTTLPVVELNRFIIDVPGDGMWTCITEPNGRAKEIVKRQTG